MDGSVYGYLDGNVFVIGDIHRMCWVPPYSTDTPVAVEGAGKPDLSDCFVVDYVRVFDEAE